MLRSRIIPCLLVKNGGLVKTVKFADPKYVGDPINAVKIFNEKEADELIVLDIDASIKNKEPDFEMIKNLACECRMPLCYGGGVRTLDHFKRIIGLGVEKVAFSSLMIKDPSVISKASEFIGSQSIVAVLDVKKKLLSNQYNTYIHNSKISTGKLALDIAKKMEDYGVGEIVVNSIDNDGTMSGYDAKLISQIRNSIKVPLTVLGGAGSLDDMKKLINDFGTIGCAAGSLFVFKGKYRAVLINYPDREMKKEIIKI